MTYLNICILLELFTIRKYREYDYGLIVRCRKRILDWIKIDDKNIYYDKMLDYIYSRALTLPEDEFLFIRSFIKFVKLLTNF